jgi:hypothetical protein
MWTCFFIFDYSRSILSINVLLLPPATRALIVIFEYHCVFDALNNRKALVKELRSNFVAHWIHYCSLGNWRKIEIVRFDLWDLLWVLPWRVMASTWSHALCKLEGLMLLLLKLGEVWVCSDLLSARILALISGISSDIVLILRQCYFVNLNHASRW